MKYFYSYTYESGGITGYGSNTTDVFPGFLTYRVIENCMENARKDLEESGLDRPEVIIINIQRLSPLSFLFD